MRIPDEFRKCVVFIGYKHASNGDFIATGTGFLVGRPLISDRSAVYLVTADHNIQKIADQGPAEVWVRFNLSSGGTEAVPIKHTEWTRSPRRADVAVVGITLDIPRMDHRFIGVEAFLTDDRIQEEDIGVGTEVYITGLFKPHTGWAKNVPIMRVGVIAAMDEEKVNTREHGFISAYLIEARSIGGLSGSPVLTHTPLLRLKDDKFEFAKATYISVFGLIHAHYDVHESRLDAALEADAAVKNQPERVNMGIAVVVPWYEIIDTLNAPNIIGHEMKARQLISFSNAAKTQAEILNEQFRSSDPEGSVPFPVVRTGRFSVGEIVFAEAVRVSPAFGMSFR